MTMQSETQTAAQPALDPSALCELGSDGITLDACHRHMAAIHAVCAPLSATLDLDERLLSILNASVEAVGGTAGTVFLYRASDDQLVFQHVVGPKAVELTGQVVSAVYGVAGTVFRTQKPQITRLTTRTEGEGTQAGKSAGLAEQGGFAPESTLSVPLKAGAGKPSGVLQIINKAQGEFTLDDLYVLEIIASVAAEAIETANLHRDLQLASVARAVGDLSHDIKNKVSPISLSADTLGPMLDEMFVDLKSLSATLPLRQQEELRQATSVAEGFYRESFEIIAHQVRVIMDYAQMIASAVKGIVSETQLAMHSLSAVLEEQVMTLDTTAQTLGIRLVREYAPEDRCRFDRFLIERAVYNLVNNAVSETPPGGTVTIRTELCPGGEPFPLGDYVLISVEDTGRGMPPPVLERILRGEAFSTKPGGSGLGTRIVRNATLSHYGIFEGSSREGAGSTFRVRLPLST